MKMVKQKGMILGLPFVSEHLLLWMDHHDGMIAEGCTAFIHAAYQQNEP